VEAPRSVSIVIVNWNAGEHLLACLRSVAEHPLPFQCDVLVIDNASTDGSAERALEEFPWARVIFNEENRGLAPGNNQGISESTGDAILISNPDIIFREGSIAALLEVLERRPRAAFAIPRLLHPDGSLQTGAGDLPTVTDALRGRRSAYERADDGTRRAFWWDGWAHDSERRIGHGAEAAYLVRREALDEIGLQDEHFILDWEGVDWAARAADAGWEVWFTPRSEIVHAGGASISQISMRWVLSTHRGMARYMRRHLGLRGWLAQPLVAGRAVAKIASGLGPEYGHADRGQTAAGSQPTGASVGDDVLP
jgi:GT2 family glycosyltransferase